MQYDYKNQYPGEERWRVNTKRKRPSTTPAQENSNSATSTASKTQKMTAREAHYNSLEGETHKYVFGHPVQRSFDSPRNCSFCGAKTYYACGTCEKSAGKPLPLCVPTIGKKKQAKTEQDLKEYNCHALYHLPMCKEMGLCNVVGRKERAQWGQEREERMAAIQEKVMKAVKR